MRQTIPVSERSLLGAIFIVMSALVLISKVNSYRAEAELEAVASNKEEILVTISGAVSRPGQYLIPSGTTIEQALRKAKPKTFANLKVFSLDQILEKPIELIVEELSEVRVKVTGAVVKELDLVLPVKSRICDLKHKITLSNEADKAFFRSKKFLKDGEQIEVPKKTVEDNSRH